MEAKGRKGQWSEWHRFKVIGAPPSPLSPADGARVPPSEALFSWEPAVGASPASYRFERTRVGSSTIAETVVTSAHAYAPTSVIPEGDWQWRVTALDTTGNALGTSMWRSFIVYAGPRSVTPPVVDGSGKAGTILSATPGTWDLAGVSEAYQWMRGSLPVAGATSLTYEVTSADLGKEVKLRVTGSKDGWSNTVVYSNGVFGVSGEAPLMEQPPEIAGSGRLGTLLTSTPPVWNLTEVTNKYQWLRDGENISWATSPTYTVAPADVGKSITLRVTGSKPGHAVGIANSNAISALPGEAPVNTAAPTISGTRTVGSYLSASAGSWDGYFSYGYQWLRNGYPISGATGPSYRLVTSDAGRAISVQVTASKTGYQPGVATSVAVRISKLTSRTSASLVDGKIRRTQRGQVRVAVTVPGIARPTGTISIFDGTRKIKGVTLSKTMRGRLTVTLPRLGRGKHPISARYSGTATTAASRSGRVTLTVTR